jgi:mono/diheme cytochrome c family protein
MTARMESETRSKLDKVEEQTQAVLSLLFGTPDEPRWPERLSNDPTLKDLVNVGYLERAAGPFGRKVKDVETGLFRKHCTQCHGITGDGLGPAAALLSPYPRDFRRGTFKFKSTAHSVRPTLEDLIETIENGVPGTSMPAMANLKKDKHYADDIVVLAHYVRYLAIRGEVERQIMMGMVPELDLDAGESIYDPDLKDKDPTNFEKQKEALDEIVFNIAKKWSQSQPSSVRSNGERIDVRSQESKDLSTTNFLISARRGKELFRGTTAACSQCHGEEGNGLGKIRDFDEWTRDWTIRAGIDPKDPKQWKPLKKLGLLKPVYALPRNLQWGTFRNGSDPDSIFRTLVNGIEGTPMPAAARLPEIKNGLTDEQIWDLVNYCQAIGNPALRKQVDKIEVAKDGK